MKNGRTQVTPSTAADISTRDTAFTSSATTDDVTTEQFTIKIDRSRTLIVQAQIVEEAARPRERGGATISAPPMYADDPVDFINWTRETGGYVRRIGKLVEQRSIPIAGEAFSITLEMREAPEAIRVYLSGSIIGACEWPRIRGPLWKMVSRYRGDARPLILLYIPESFRYVAVQVEHLTPTLSGRVVSFGEAQNDAEPIPSKSINRAAKARGVA